MLKLCILKRTNCSQTVNLLLLFRKHIVGYKCVLSCALRL